MQASLENTEISISVIIPVFNGEKLIDRCLNSIVHQNTSAKIEIIIIDDGSTDNSVEIINEFSENLILLQQKNQGPAAARNKGIEAASGKYLAFLDADDYWEPEFLKETVNFLEVHQEPIAVSVGQIHKVPRKGESIVPKILEEIPSKFTEPILINNFFQFWAQHNHVCTGSVLMRTEIVKMTGGQRTDLRITEDLEFWAYLALFGKWGFIPEILFVSDGGEVSRQIGWMEKNKMRWASAPSIDVWEARIKEKLPLNLEVGYYTKRGQIVRNLAYSMLLAGKLERARLDIRQNSKFLPSDKLSLVLRTGAIKRPVWIVLTQVLFLREKYRKI